MSNSKLAGLGTVVHAARIDRPPFFASGCCAICALIIFPVGILLAQPFPTKPIRIVVPSPAGGPSDFAARAVSQYLPQYVGQSVIVDNRPGGAGLIGADLVAKAPPDGHTLLVTTGGLMLITPLLMDKMPYQPGDFAPITNLISGPSYFLVHPSVPVHNLKELIALAKVRPGQLTYGSAGPAQISHLNGELLKSLARIDITQIPYKGTANMFTQLVGGEVSMAFTTSVDSLTFVRAGRLRAIAVTSLQRSPAMPEVPTMNEAGLKGYDVTNWNAIWAPAKTPRDVILRLNRDIAKALQTPELKARIAALGNVIVADSADDFVAFCRKETEKWSKLVKGANIKME
jgi:tripartite-type tricarboxylate transporter receptor subunit TctC